VSEHWISKLEVNLSRRLGVWSLTQTVCGFDLLVHLSCIFFFKDGSSVNFNVHAFYIKSKHDVASRFYDRILFSKLNQSFPNCSRMHILQMFQRILTLCLALLLKITAKTNHN
jgi:hypothetical protein